MTYVDFGNLWSLMSKYSFIPDPDCIQDDLTCLICKKLMIDSFQSGCGCQYCYKCIQEYLGGENKHCPGNKRECKEEYLSLDVNVHRSAILNRKISKLKVICPNESCQCVEELSRMENHIRLCMKETVDCPYVVLGCDDKINDERKISTHLSEYTLNHTHLLLEYIQNIKNEVSNLKEESKNNDNMKKDIENLKGELGMTKFKITSLEDELEMTKSIVKSLNEELRVKENIKYEVCTLKEESWNNDNNLKSELELLKSILTSLKEELRVKDNITSELKQEVLQLKIDFEKNKLESIHLKESKAAEEIKLKEIKNEIKLWKQDFTKKEEMTMKNVNKSIKETKWRIDKLIVNMERMDVWTHGEDHVGEVFFSVDRFSVRKSQNEWILSPYFYSHDKGYKLRLEVFPGGEDEDQGTHLSVFLIMCKGEYDDMLEWPYKYSIKISVINQSDQTEYISKTFNRSNEISANKHHFNKPCGQDNGGLGIHKFLDLEDIRSIAGLSVNDVVVIKCTVGAPPIHYKNQRNRRWRTYNQLY